MPMKVTSPCKIKWFFLSKVRGLRSDLRGIIYPAGRSGAAAGAKDGLVKAGSATKLIP